MDVIEPFLQSPVKVLAALTIVSVVVYLGIKPYLRFFPAPLPPSPPAEPFIGHWRKLPLENAHLQYMKDAETYSE
jgi:hypothetical protein